MKTVVLGGEGGDKVYGKHSEDPFHPKSIWSAGENQSDLLEKVSLIWWTLCELLSNHYCTTLKRLEIDMKHIWNKYEITLKQIWNIQTTMKHLWNKCKTNTGQIWNRKNALVALSCLLDWEANGGSAEEHAWNIFETNMKHILNKYEICMNKIWNRYKIGGTPWSSCLAC